MGKSGMTFLFCLSLITGCGADFDSAELQSLPQAALSISDGPVYHFGLVAVGNTATHLFTVTNFGQQTATSLDGTFYLSRAFGFTGGSYPGTGGTCTRELAPQANCTLSISFAPYVTETSQLNLGIYYFTGATYQTTSSPLLMGQGISSE